MAEMQLTNETIKDDAYSYIQDELSQVVISLGMYISHTGKFGFLHCIKEIVNNALDEVVNPNALSKSFSIVFDEIENSVSIVDESRGIPFEKLVEVATKKHSSTKFKRDEEYMKFQAGRNGERNNAVVKSF